LRAAIVPNARGIGDALVGAGSLYGSTIGVGGSDGTMRRGRRRCGELPMDEPDGAGSYVTLAGACAILDLARPRVLRLAADGRLRSVTIGGTLVVERADVERLLDEGADHLLDRLDAAEGKRWWRRFDDPRRPWRWIPVAALLWVIVLTLVFFGLLS
jgi:hypothetical protein